MSYAVVTTFSQKGYEVYGKRMVESFEKFWPADIALYVYYEGEKPQDASPRAVWLSLDKVSDRNRFAATHTDGDPRDYRTCVVRYCHKVFAMTSAPRVTGHLIWLDGDCESFAPATPALLQEVCAELGQVGSFLGRPHARHTETGFWSVRTDNRGSQFLDELRKLYTSDEIMKLPELHDCMAFDSVRRKFERAGYRFRNICPGARGLDAFIHSPLKEFITHNKGPQAKLKNYGDDMISEVAA